MGEGAAEVGPVDIVALLLGDVDFLAAGTVDLDARSPYLLAHADGEGGVAIAEDAGADPEGPLGELLLHDRQSLGGDDVPGVDQSVDVGRLLVDRQVSRYSPAYLSSSSSSSSGGSGRRIISSASLP